MTYLRAIGAFLKKHYEKIILCVVLLGLAAAAVWMSHALGAIKDQVGQSDVDSMPHSGKGAEPVNMTNDIQILSQITNPPPVVLSGDHNLFNPVTWKRKANGDPMKILKTGPDALEVTNIVPLYTIVGYDHPSDGGVYVMSIQVHSAKKPMDYAKVGEKPRSGLYIIRGVKGNVDSPDALQLEFPDTEETVWVTSSNAYQRVDSHMADLKYEPDQRTLNKQHVNDTIDLDGDPYKIIEITNNLVRVQSIKNTKVTTIRWNGSP